MKLRDASIRGFDNNEILSAELLDYQRKVGSSYILEKQVVEPAVEKLYDRRKEELRVSHLMVRATAGSNIDSLRQVAQIYLDSINNGADYETMVKRHSDDNFSKASGGDIFYVTGGQLPWEFEDAAYNTPKGQIYPALVQTKFGFHIIKVTDRKPRIAKIKASHILISYQDSEGKIDSAAAKLKMDTVLAKLSSGESFEEVAKQYSMDPGSKDKGGDLGFFERRMMVKEFDEVAFNLEIGQVSNVVKTNFGYHIIKCTDKQPIPPFESEKENLKKVYRQGRFNDDNNILVDSLKAKYNFQQNQQTVDFLLANSDGFHFGEEHPKKDEIGAMTLFTAAGKNFNALDVLQRIGQDKEFASKELKSEAFEPALKKISGEMLFGRRRNES
ncbi:MAG: peptidylprolyl isomerase [Ignavibacteriales bacterium]|nr:peptidylprolyl isomerase [Ignavibacteriales bacterium]